MSDQSSLCSNLCFIFVLLEFFFPINKHSTFVTILTEKQTDQVHLKEINFFFNVMDYDFRTFPNYCCICHNLRESDFKIMV